MLRLVLLAGGLSLLITGCEPELGECNFAQANQIAFFYDESKPSESGTPAYLGQALMQKNCSPGGICHSPAADGASRYGAPGGFNFDVQSACEVGMEDTCGSSYERLDSNARRTFDHARSIMAEVEAGTMPPSGEDSEMVIGAAGQWFRANGEAVFDTINGGDTPLPSIDSEEGRDILRNWLACGAPVVIDVGPPDSGDPGTTCGPPVGTNEFASCYVRFEPPEPPTANWDAIYDFFSGSNCVTACHDPTGAPDVFAQSQLDLSDQATAYAEMVGAMAEGGECAGTLPIVDPGNPAGSLLVQKLTGEQSCGEPMPQGRPLLPEEYVRPITDWIDAGAPEM